MESNLPHLDAEAAGAGRAMREWRPWRASPAVVLLAAILLVLIVPPTLFLINASIHTTKVDGSFDQLTLRYYGGLFTNPHFAGSLLNTLVYAFGSSIIALALGVVQALIVERTNTPGRGYVFLGAVISLGIPHVLYVVAWLLLLGRSGPVNAAIDVVLGAGRDGPALDVHSMWGMILIEGFGFAPLAFLLMSAVLRSADASMEEAAIMSGAGLLKTFRAITLRLSAPGLAAVLLLFFIRAVESFEVPALVGLAGNVTVLTTSIFQSERSVSPPSQGEAAAYSVCLLLIVALLLWWYGRLARHAHRYQTITGKGYRARLVDLGRARYFTALLLLLIFALAIVLPVAMLAFTSLQPFYEGPSADSLARLTLDNYRTVLEPGSFRDAVANTLVLGAATATLVVPLTAICAWLAARRWRGAWLLDQLATAPLVFPALVMSVAFLNVFVNLPLPLYGTLLSIVIASVVRHLPYGMRYAYAGVLQIHAELEEAAVAAGAGPSRVFVRVVLPLIAAALVSCWLFVFLLTVQSVALPLLLAGPGTELVAVTLFDLWQNGQVTELAAMGVLWLAFATAVGACFHVITRRYRVLLEGQ